MSFRVAMRSALAITGATTIGFAYHVHKKAKSLPPDFRGPLPIRMGEVMHSFRQRMKIQDRYTAENLTRI